MIFFYGHFLLPLIQKGQCQLLARYKLLVLVNRLGGLSLHRNNVDRLTDRLDMTIEVYRVC